MSDEEEREIEVLVRYSQGQIEIEVGRVKVKRDEVRPLIGMLSNRIDRWEKRGKKND